MVITGKHIRIISKEYVNNYYNVIEYSLKKYRLASV